VGAPAAGRSPVVRWRILIALLALVAGAALLAAAAGHLPVGVALAIVFPLLAGVVFLEVFFRDPDRRPGAGIVSPADGRVQFVREEGDRVRIAVFMNVTDVHVNRFPLDAEVLQVGEGGHGFAPAYAARAEGNVQREYRLKTAIGEVTLVQITGIVARRLVSFVGEGDYGRKGDRLGMIILGSRVDLLLPKGRAEVTVRPGERVRAGVSPLATERA
jgi:phosphatidylserine decarboxylase